MFRIIQRQFTTSQGPNMNKYMSVARQGKIMNKLYAERISGSKKRWFPNNDTASQKQDSMFKTSPFGKPKLNKNTTRRMTVLNKLFMKHISDYLATGEVSDMLLGRGLQITRVKISPDFAYANVWWLGSGEVVQDAELESELKRCSGILRHELSQLCLMGMVPLIKFVRDKTSSSWVEVDKLLKTIDLDPDDTDLRKSEFFGETQASVSDLDREDQLPKMRHDVLGLDHRDITTRILGKMRKSKQAWDLHYNTMAERNRVRDNEPKLLATINKKISEIPKTDDEQFERFMFRWQERRNKPERKRFRRSDHFLPANVDDEFETVVLNAQQRQLYEEKDFIHEDDESNDKHNS